VVALLGTRQKYNAIKRLLLTERPVPSQCVLTKTMNKPKGVLSIVTKILVQITCKVGCVPWMVNFQPSIFSKTMIIGIDVSHKGNQQTRKAITSMVSSGNGAQTAWYTQIVEEDEHPGALSNTLTGMIGVACKNFYQFNNNQPPDRLIFYREGATPKKVLIHEVPQIIKVNESFPNFNPELVVIACEKRVNTRIFRMAGQVSNPVPGTVVDTSIVDKEFLDFYLIPQNVREGTVTPTKFQVVYNRSGFNIDLIQSLTYSLCHMYYNWFGTVRLPAPIMFAKKAATLSTAVLKTEPKTVSTHLANKLYHL